MAATLVHATQLLAQGDASAARALLLGTLSNNTNYNTTTPRLTALATALLLRTADETEDGSPDALWRTAERVYPSSESMPCVVALAGMLLFASQNNIKQAERIFEHWVCYQSTATLLEVQVNPTGQVATQYVDLCTVYIHHVLAARNDYSIAREYLDMNGYLSAEQKQTLHALINQLELEFNTPKVALPKPDAPSSLSESAEPSDTAKQPPMSTLPKSSDHHPLAASSSPRPNWAKEAGALDGDATKQQARGTDGSKSGVTASSVSESLATKPAATVAGSTLPTGSTGSITAAKMRKAPNLKAQIKMAIKYAFRHQGSLFSMVCMLVGVWMYRNRDSKSVLAVMQVLQRFLRTLQMASSI
ncbi:hypothetical protein HDU98_008465 [Podochytrium sp. JEL0797]|nr:hypothetical protein HDU98_008465 [Podochytrium sp. JEL0797]